MHLLILVMGENRASIIAALRIFFLLCDMASMYDMHFIYVCETGLTFDILKK